MASKLLVDNASASSISRADADDENAAGALDEGESVDATDLRSSCTWEAALDVSERAGGGMNVVLFNDWSMSPTACRFSVLCDRCC